MPLIVECHFDLLIYRSHPVHEHMRVLTASAPRCAERRDVRAASQFSQARGGQCGHHRASVGSVYAASQCERQMVERLMPGALNTIGSNERAFEPSHDGFEVRFDVCSLELH